MAGVGGKLPRSILLTHLSVLPSGVPSFAGFAAMANIIFLLLRRWWTMKRATSPRATKKDDARSKMMGKGRIIAAAKARERSRKFSGPAVAYPSRATAMKKGGKRA